jgi:hypothetical protein
MYERISGIAGFASGGEVRQYHNHNPPIGAAFCVLADFWDVRQLSYFEYERSNAIWGYGEGMDIGQGRAAPVLRNLVTVASIARLKSPLNTIQAFSSKLILFEAFFCFIAKLSVHQRIYM